PCSSRLTPWRLRKASQATRPSHSTTVSSRTSGGRLLRLVQLVSWAVKGGADWLRLSGLLYFAPVPSDLLPVSPLINDFGAIHGVAPRKSVHVDAVGGQILIDGRSTRFYPPRPK